MREERALSEAGRRFLIDVSMIRGGGGFTFASRVLPRLARAAPGDRFRVLVRHPPLAQVLPPLPNLEIQRLPQRPGLMARLRFTYLEARRIATRWQADLYYAAGDYAPIGAPCPVVASFQNMNLFTPLEIDYPASQRLRLALLRGVSRVTARSCDRIHFVSESSARAIGERIGLPEARRAVIPHGIDAAEWDPGDVPRRGPVLSVSSIYPYKNFVRLIEAYAELARRRPGVPELAIVGDDQDPPYRRKMEEARQRSGVSERIRVVGEVSHAEIPGFYAEAPLFVFPSYLETFGLPLLEAMASGVPIAAAELESFREVAGDAALYFDPHDSAAMAAVMERILFEEGLAEELVRRGRRRVAELTWERTAQGLLALFDELLDRRGRSG